MMQGCQRVVSSGDGNNQQYASGPKMEWSAKRQCVNNECRPGLKSTFSNEQMDIAQAKASTENTRTVQEQEASVMLLAQRQSERTHKGHSHNCDQAGATSASHGGLPLQMLPKVGWPKFPKFEEFSPDWNASSPSPSSPPVSTAGSEAGDTCQDNNNKDFMVQQGQQRQQARDPEDDMMQGQQSFEQTPENLNQTMLLGWFRG